MVLGSTQKEEQGVLLFYESMDLQNWKLVNRKVKTPEYGWMWECPDYFETEGGKVLLLSAMKLIKVRKCRGIIPSVCRGLSGRYL